MLLLPPWSILHSRLWKMQVPYLARHYRVVRSTVWHGGSDWPAVRHRTSPEYAADALAVMDVTATERAVVVSFSLSAGRGLLVTPERPPRPDRVAAQVFVCPTTPLSPFAPAAARRHIDASKRTPTATRGGPRRTLVRQRDYRGFLEFFFAEVFPEPHSTKQIEDAIGWALDTTAEPSITTRRASSGDASSDLQGPHSTKFGARCLVIQGAEDAIPSALRRVRCSPTALGSCPARAVGGFGPRSPTPATRRRSTSSSGSSSTRSVTPQGPRLTAGREARAGLQPALYVSSPIGLGHARRDVAIAAELRKLHPDLEIDWLAQHPVTNVLEARGERIHPGLRSSRTSPATSRMSAASTTCTASRPPANMDEILW